MGETCSCTCSDDAKYFQETNTDVQNNIDRKIAASEPIPSQPSFQHRLTEEFQTMGPILHQQQGYIPNQQTQSLLTKTESAPQIHSQYMNQNHIMNQPITSQYQTGYSSHPIPPPQYNTGYQQQYYPQPINNSSYRHVPSQNYNAPPLSFTHSASLLNPTNPTNPINPINPTNVPIVKSGIIDNSQLNDSDYDNNNKIKTHRSSVTSQHDPDYDIGSESPDDDQTNKPPLPGQQSIFQMQEQLKMLQQHHSNKMMVNINSGARGAYVVGGPRNVPRIINDQGRYGQIPMGHVNINHK